MTEPPEIEPSESERRLSAILMADVVGYSRMMGADEESTVATLANRRAIFTSYIPKFRGRVVDMRFRIGINLGEVVVEEDAIYGDGVNVAARLESLAEPGGICISGSVHSNIQNKLPYHYEFIGKQEVKNIDQPIHTFRVQTEPGAASHRMARAKRGALHSWYVPLVAAAVTVIAAAGLTEWLPPPAARSRGPDRGLDHMVTAPRGNVESRNREGQYWGESKNWERGRSRKRATDTVLNASPRKFHPSAIRSTLGEVRRSFQRGRMAIRIDGAEFPFVAGGTSSRPEKWVPCPLRNEIPCKSNFPYALPKIRPRFQVCLYRGNVTVLNRHRFGNSGVLNQKNSLRITRHSAVPLTPR